MSPLDHRSFPLGRRFSGSRSFARFVVLMVLGLSQLPATSEAAGVRDYYDIDDIALPEGARNVDGMAFLPDGRLVVCFHAGQVYFYDVSTKVWTLFADGLHLPLGVLALSNSEVLVMQMPELTLLQDRDGDGRADVFKTVSDDFGMSGNYAEFAFGPVKDAKGNLFFALGTGSHFGKPLTNEVRGFYSEQGAWGRMNSPVPFRNWIMKVTPEGKTVPWAAGFREPNGLGFDPQGRLYAIDNQGDWVAASSLFHVRQGGFYGHVPGLVWREDFQGGKQPLDTPVEELDRLRTRPAVVFPFGDLSNSPTQPMADTTGGKFGPFGGQLFLGEMNYHRLLRVMLEEVDGQMQGAVTPFFDDEALRLGSNRLAFDPQGALWVGQTKHQGWVGDSGLQRISWKGVVPLEVSSMRLTEDGFELAFTRAIDAAVAVDPAAYALRTYFYNYHEKYGSDKYDVREVKITAVDVSEDRLRVTLHLDELEAWRLYDLKFTGIVSEDGAHALVSPWVVYTLNHLLRDTPPPRAPLPEAQPPRRPPQLPPGGIKSVGGPQDFRR